MNAATETQIIKWALWRKLLFRFFFIYIMLQVLPWLLGALSFAEIVTNYYFDFTGWLVQLANKYIFHVKDVLVPTNGSGDTSFGWAEQWTFLLIALTGTLIWTIADRKRSNYKNLNYWLCLLTRYYIALVAFTYGFYKIFLSQMPFPSQSQLATPLGDFLPMRLSWLFIGYSAPYQFFSGLMECLAALLVLYRRTTTLGILVATGVFVNVMMLNLCYDIPVKLFSMNMVFVCLFLMVNEHERIACFFVLGKPAPACSLYHFSYGKKWMRRTRLAFKLGFIIIIAYQFYDIRKSAIEYTVPTESKVIKNGVYNVAAYAVNSDTLPPLLTDTLRWQDVIIDADGAGSINTRDTVFRRRYNRAYFSFTTDSAKPVIHFKKFFGDSTNLFSLQYQAPDSNTIIFWGKKQNDSLYVKLTRSSRHFQLAERQFHWLSEANR